MQVTLKKGSELARQAIEAASKIDAVASTSVSFYTKGEPLNVVEAAFDAASSKFAGAVDSTMELLMIGYEIRRLLNTANNSVPTGETQSIADLLTERAMNEALEKRLISHISRAEIGVAEPSVEEAAARIQQQHALIAKGGENARYLERSFEVRAIEEESIELMRTQLMDLRRRKSDLTDALAGRNLNTKITLSDDVVAVLKKHKIIG